MFYQELPTISVVKKDLPYPSLIRSAFDKYELCGAVKFIPGNDKTIFSGYNKSHYETASFQNRVLEIQQHDYSKKGSCGHIVSNGYSEMGFNVTFGQYIKDFQTDDPYLKRLSEVPDDLYTVEHIKQAIQHITSFNEYKFVYAASKAQSATNTCSAFHFNNLNDLLSCIECRSAYISGFNSPFVYYNVSGVFFPFHRDPMGVGVCNINCYGKPNIWFLIPPQNAKIFMLYF